MKPTPLIEIQQATDKDTEVLALLGRVTYAESHGHYIKDKTDLKLFLDSAFSVSSIREHLSDPKTLFYLITLDHLPVGYIKLVINVQNENVASYNNCLMEKIYVLDEFIPIKLGHKLLEFAEKKAVELQLDTMWLTVYTENIRAIKFYQKNGYHHTGEIDFLVNGVNYENHLLTKKL